MMSDKTMRYVLFAFAVCTLAGVLAVLSFESLTTKQIVFLIGALLAGIVIMGYIIVLDVKRIRYDNARILNDNGVFYSMLESLMKVLIPEETETKKGE